MPIISALSKQLKRSFRMPNSTFVENDPTVRLVSRRAASLRYAVFLTSLPTRCGFLPKTKKSQPHIQHADRLPGAQAGSKSNPVLKLNQPADDDSKGGWYWIEILPYDTNAGNTGLITNGSNNLALNLIPSVAYRITAVAHGLKPNTQVVLQSTYVRQKMKN